MINFRDPELLLLAVPVLWAFWRWGRARGVTGWLRGVVVICLLMALAGPRLNWGGRGLNLFVIVDRSRSMRESALANVGELIANLEENRGPGDRIGIVTFGANAKIERPVSQTDSFDEFTMAVRPDGSDLHGAIERALAIAESDRPTRLLVLSDGESNGPDPLDAARHARDAGVPIDVRAFPNRHVGDIAVDRIDLPKEVAPREPFQFSVVVSTDRELSTTLSLARDGEPIETRAVQLKPGRNRFQFLDQVETPAFATYTARLGVDDSRPENDRAIGVLRVTAGPRILLLNQSGENDPLAEALRSASLPVDVVVATEHPLTLDALDPYGTVILENVPANDLRRVKLEQLARFVEDLGGGLMMTGGRDSYGAGGYHNSPLDPVLPVSMDLDDDRGRRVAIAIALDRSGSMAVPVNDNLVKMDLANRGAIEAVRLLSPDDYVAILAVDTKAHVVVPLRHPDDQEEIIERVQEIDSAEGGIYIEEALLAAAAQLDRLGNDLTRHIILFADAADSEEPGDYRDLLQEFHASGITVSVIGLGTEADPDAELLREIAALGHGNITFTTDAEELPRLFTQEAMNVAQNTFLVAPEGGTIPGRLVEQARLMGDLHEAPLPDVRGYNLTRLKTNASLAAVSLDEEAAPWSAFWYRGLGRAVAVTFEAAGEFTGPMANWPGYDELFVSHVRWLQGNGDAAGVYIDAERRGLDAIVTVELDPERPQRESLPELVVVPPGTRDAAARTVDLTWTGPHSIEGRFRLQRNGTYRTQVRFGEREMARGPAITLPYSPEYMNRVGQPTGEEILAEVAKLSGGRQRTNVLAALKDPPPSRGSTPLLPILMIAAICLFVIEIAGRRLALWPDSRPSRSLDEPSHSGDDSGHFVRRRRRQQSIAASEPKATPDPVATRLDEIYTRAKHRSRR